MFGPESGKDGWEDLTFMYDMVRIRDQPLCSSFLHIFSSEVRKYCRYVLPQFLLLSHSDPNLTGEPPSEKYSDLLLQGCKMLEMTCEKHDRLAAQSQFLTHTIGR